MTDPVVVGYIVLGLLTVVFVGVSMYRMDEDELNQLYEQLFENGDDS